MYSVDVHIGERDSNTTLYIFIVPSVSNCDLNDILLFTPLPLPLPSPLSRPNEDEEEEEGGADACSASFFLIVSISPCLFLWQQTW